MAQRNTNPKVVGYGGFQSYGVLPYPSNKMGKFDKQDEIYEKTLRVDDQLKFYQNYNRQADTIYGSEIVNTTQPEDFANIQHVRKGMGAIQLEKFKNPGASKVSGIRNTLEYPQDMFPRAQSDVSDQMAMENTLNLTSKTDQVDEAQRKELRGAAKTLNLPEDLRVEKKVANALYDIYYVPGYDKFSLGNNPDFKEEDSRKNRLRTLAEKNMNTNTLPNLSRNSNMSGAVMGMVNSSTKGMDTTGFGPKIDVQINTCGFHPAKRENGNRTGAIRCANPQTKLQTGTEFWQSTAANNYEKWDNIAEARATQPEWTLHRPAYSTQYKLGASEYRYSFGELGSNPRDKLPAECTTLQKREDTLKYGTTECTNHPPGYTGFIPNTNISFGKALDQAKGDATRDTFIKKNITENFHRQIPGYAGHKPKAAVNDRGDVRDSIYYANENLMRNI